MQEERYVKYCPYKNTRNNTFVWWLIKRDLLILVKLEKLSILLSSFNNLWPIIDQFIDLFAFYRFFKQQNLAWPPCLFSVFCMYCIQLYENFNACNLSNSYFQRFSNAITDTWYIDSYLCLSWQDLTGLQELEVLQGRLFRYWFCVQCSRRPDIDIKFQAFEGLKLAEKDPNGGSRLRSQVCRDLDCIAAQIKLAAAEKAKKVADAVISILYIEEKMPFIGIHDSDLSVMICRYGLYICSSVLHFWLTRDPSGRVKSAPAK